MPISVYDGILRGIVAALEIVTHDCRQQDEGEHDRAGLHALGPSKGELPGHDGCCCCSRRHAERQHGDIEAVPRFRPCQAKR